jgi:hypothetical protein
MVQPRQRCQGEGSTSVPGLRCAHGGGIRDSIWYRRRYVRRALRGRSRQAAPGPVSDAPLAVVNRGSLGRVASRNYRQKWQLFVRGAGGTSVALAPFMRSVFLLALIALSTSACGPLVSAEQLNAPVRPMHTKPVRDVALITQKPDRRFVEVSMLHISSDSTDWSSGSLFEKLRSFGAKQGCDAVVIVGRSDSRDLLQPSRPTAGYMASCIQYLDERDMASVP